MTLFEPNLAPASTSPSSLTKESIRHLKTLFEAQQDFPSPKLIDTWAVLLKAQPEDVVAWLEAQRSSTGPDHTHQFPTPLSTSPEPLSGTSNASFESSMKTDSPHSPVVPSLSLRSGNLPHVSSTSGLCL